jgi:Flp pilus assembly protein TadG
MNTRLRQLGTTTVEFAIVGLVLAMVVLGVIEFSRIIFTMNALQEGARRGARVAAVCQVGNANVAKAAVLMERMPDLSTANVIVEYLDANGAVLGNAAGSYGSIAYVRVRVVDYSVSLRLPFLSPTFNVPEFSSTLPRESLGIPRYGAPPEC